MEEHRGPKGQVVGYACIGAVQPSTVVAAGSPALSRCSATEATATDSHWQLAVTSHTFCSPPVINFMTKCEPHVFRVSESSCELLPLVFQVAVGESVGDLQRCHPSPCRGNGCVRLAFAGASSLKLHSH